MEGPTGGSFVSRHEVQLTDEGTPIVGRGRGMPPPQYASTPMDGVTGAGLDKNGAPTVGRGRGMVKTGSASGLGTSKVTDEMSGTSESEEDIQIPNRGDGTDYEDKDMIMDDPHGQDKLGRDKEAEERCDPEDREADIWYKKELAEIRHKKEQEEKDAEIRYLKGQVANRYKKEVEEKEDVRQLRRSQGEQAALQYKLEQEAKDKEIQRLSGLLDGARSMVRVLSSFSDIKMDESKETYGSMPVLETMREAD
jgi:hypothetical protein